MKIAAGKDSQMTDAEERELLDEVLWRLHDGAYSADEANRKLEAIVRTEAEALGIAVDDEDVRVLSVAAYEQHTASDEG
jgi:hypothetical protein